MLYIFLDLVFLSHNSISSVFSIASFNCRQSSSKMADEKHEKNSIHTPPVLESDNDHQEIHSIIQVGDIIHVHASPEQGARVLKKIDWLYVFHPLESRICTNDGLEVYFR